MEFNGTVIWIGESRSGQGKSGEWKSLEFAVEDKSGQYPKKACFEANTKSYDFAVKLKVGDNVKISYDVDANEYKGRYYNKLKAFRIEVVGASQAAPQQQAQQDNFGVDTGQELPF